MTTPPASEKGDGWPVVRGADLAHTLHASRDRTPVTVVVPVYNGGLAVRRCLDAVRRHTFGARILVIDDCSTDASTVQDLLRRERLGDIQLIRHEVNLGYTRTANEGLRAAADGDVVLVNSDTEVGPGWLAGLRRVARSRARIATVSALSDNAGAMSMPVARDRNPWPSHLSWDEIARAAGQAPLPLAVETPTGHGFCMLVTRAAIDALGGFDEAAFPRGYGEENDFSMRARELGMVNLIAPRVFVRHARGASFGDERTALMAAARNAVDARHPTYTADVRAWMGSKQMRRLRAAYEDLRTRLSATDRVLPRRLYVLHHGGGGTPATNLDLITALGEHQESFVLESLGARALRLSVLRGKRQLPVAEWAADRPFAVTDTWRQDYAERCAATLVGLGIEMVHIRHLIGHPLTTMASVCHRLEIPVVISSHDQYLICPSVHLLDENERFCGGTCTPGQGTCQLPTPFVARVPTLKHAWIHEWRRRVDTVLDTAAAIVTTTPGAAELMAHAYPRQRAKIRTIEHGRDLGDRFAPLRRGAGRVRPGPFRAVAAANWARHKGSGYLRALAAALGPAVELHVLGRGSEEFADIATTYGPFARDAQREIWERIDPDFALQLSICPETYSHTLTEAWAFGLPVVATDIGAVAERIRRQGGGLLVPVDDPVAGAARINTLLGEPGALGRLRDGVPRDAIRSRAAMAEDYRELYASVTDGDQRRVRVGYVVHGRLGSYPGSAHVRVLSRLRSPEGQERVAGRQVWPSEIGRPDLMSALDTVVVQRDALGEHAIDLIHSVRDAGARLVVELDDDLVSPADEGVPRQQRDEAERRRLRYLLAQADDVVVSTEPLAEAVRPYLRRPAVVVANALDSRAWLTEVEPALPPADDATRMLYMGTKTHHDDLLLLDGALDMLRGETARPLVLEVIGISDRLGEIDWAVALDVPATSRNYPEFVRWLRIQRRRWAVAVAPLRDTPFNRSKSDVKLLEYAMLGLPVVASNAGPYRGSRFATALVGDGPAAWADALRAILVDPSSAQARAEEARAEVYRSRMTGPRPDPWLPHVVGVPSSWRSHASEFFFSPTCISARG